MKTLEILKSEIQVQKEHLAKLRCDKQIAEGLISLELLMVFLEHGAEAHNQVLEELHLEAINPMWKKINSDWKGGPIETGVPESE